MRPYNFSAGPAMLPEEVLKQASAEMLDWQATGLSVMEMSHLQSRHSNCPETDTGPISGNCSRFLTLTIFFSCRAVPLP